MHGGRSYTILTDDVVRAHDQGRRGRYSNIRPAKHRIAPSGRTLATHTRVGVYILRLTQHTSH